MSVIVITTTIDHRRTGSVGAGARTRIGIGAVVGVGGIEFGRDLENVNKISLR